MSVLKDVTVEISGAAVAGLQRIYVEADDDILLEVQGSELTTHINENNDQFTKQTSRRNKIVVQTWSRVHKESIPEMMKDASKILLQKGFVGFIRLRKYWNSTEPSFLDRRIMKSFQKLQKKCVFIIVSEEINSSLGVRFKMTGYLVDVGVKLASQHVKIVTPCLGSKSNYKSNPNLSKTGRDLVSGVDINDVQDKLKDVVNTIHGVTETFHQNVRTLQKEILELEEENANLERKVAKIEREKDTQLKNSVQYRKYHDILYGDLETNLTRAINNVLRDDNMNNLGDSEHMLDN